MNRFQVCSNLAHLNVIFAKINRCIILIEDWRFYKFVAKAYYMETQKNVSLKVIGYDKELRQFKVEFAEKEYSVRQTGQELPDYLRCRIVESNGEVEVTPEVENHFHSGAIRRFTVKSDMTDSAGVYELIDESGFIVYLYGAESLKFFKGKQLLCRVISTEGARPHVMLYDKDKEVKITGSAFSVSKEFVKGLLFNDKEWDADSLADLILYDGMDDPFDVKCYEWVISHTSQMQKDGCLEEFLFDVRGCCMNLIEKSELLCKCSSDEVPVLLDRITMIIEHMGYVKTALATIAEGKEVEYVTDLLDKLKTSGHLYHPTKQFCVTTYLFRIKPDLMTGMIEELFNVIRTQELSHWKKEPFRSELIKQLDTYIKSNDHETAKQPDNNDLFYKGFQALAIQLLLANEDEDLIDVPLSWSMMCRYASHMKFANKKRMADMSLNSLLGLYKTRLRYGLGDTATPDKFYYHMDNWGRNQDIDRRKKAVYRSKDLVLSIEDGKITLAPDVKMDLKSALYEDVPLWRGIDVRVEKQYAQSQYKPKGSDLMALNEKLWKKVDQNLFEAKRVVVKKEVKVKTIPEIGEWVLAYVYKQNEEDKNLFHCRIADEEKGYIGEALLSVRGEEGEPGMVTYFPEPTIENFMDENGRPYLIGMTVVDKTEDDVCIMDMKQIIIDSLEEEKPNFKLNCEVGRVLTDTTLLAVSQEGYSLFVSYNSMENYLVAGDHIEVLLKSGKKWVQNGFLQAEYLGKSSVRFTLNEAFANLVSEFSNGVYEPEIDESENEVNLEKSHVMEILNIIDLVASVEDDMHVSYNYLGFASVLSRMVGNEERARYYKGQMAVAQMLHKFAVTNDVDDEKLQELHSVNKDLLSSNYNLRHQFYRLYAVSLMGEDNNEWLKAMTEEETDENLRELASLVYSYNVLTKAGIDTTDVKKAIKELLKLKGRDAYFKTYTIEEGVDVEFKSSIVYPPNAMKPDIEKQTFNIMRELCSFLNHKGGVLYLGVNDQGGGEGLEEDMKHEYFKDSRDKYDNYVRNQIVLLLGQEASHCIEAHFDDDARGRDVYILEINPCEHPVKLAGHYYQRQGSSCRKVDKDYLQTFLKNRPTEYRQLMKERGVEIVDAVVELPTATTAVKVEAVPVPKVRTVATSSLRSNVLHEYEDGYEFVEAYIHLIPNHKYMMEKTDNYQEYSYMLTLAVHNNELDGYLLLVYDDATVCKVPMSRILDKEESKEYSRFNGAQLEFACPVRKDDVLYQAYEYKGETYHRFQEVADIEEVNIGDSGSPLFDVDFDKLIKSDIVPAEMRDELPKRINDRKRIGYTTAKKEGAKSYEVIKKLGLL